MNLFSSNHSFVSNADFETLLEKNDGCGNNPIKSFPLDGNKNTSYGFAMPIRYAYHDEKINWTSKFF